MPCTTAAANAVPCIPPTLHVLLPTTPDPLTLVPCCFALPILATAFHCIISRLLQHWMQSLRGNSILATASRPLKQLAAPLTQSQSQVPQRPLSQQQRLAFLQLTTVPPPMMQQECSYSVQSPKAHHVSYSSRGTTLQWAQPCPPASNNTQNTLLVASGVTASLGGSRSETRYLV